MKTKPRKSPTRFDPSRTLSLRRQFGADFTRRLSRVRSNVFNVIGKQDAFGLSTKNVFDTPLERRWAYLSRTAKLEEFRRFLTLLFKFHLLSYKWWYWYTDEAYTKGASRTYDEVRKFALRDRVQHLAGKREFLRVLKSRGVSQITANVFCPTGEGGGVDPSCSPKKSLTPSLQEQEIDKVKSKLLNKPKTFPTPLKKDSVYYRGGGPSVLYHLPGTPIDEDTGIITIPQRFVDRAPVEELKIRELYDNQDDIRKDQILKIMEQYRDSDSPIVVADWFGDKYVIDGHHRVVMYKLAGRKTIKAKVVRLAQNGSVIESGSKEVSNALLINAARKTSQTKDVIGRYIPERVLLLSQRLEGEITSLTTRAIQDLSRVLLDGLDKDLTPMKLAGEITKALDISEGRASVIARTEIVRAQAEGQLDALEALGIPAAGIIAEVEITPDEKVCPRCRAAAEEIYTLEEARGLLPLHPNCRCAWQAKTVEITYGE